LLIVPVKHFASLPEMLDSTPGLAWLATQVAATFAAAGGLVESGYRLVWNHGRDTRQSWPPTPAPVRGWSTRSPWLLGGQVVLSARIG